jgi:hypothetical protein
MNIFALPSQTPPQRRYFIHAHFDISKKLKLTVVAA